MVNSSSQNTTHHRKRSRPLSPNRETDENSISRSVRDLQLDIPTSPDPLAVPISSPIPFGGHDHESDLDLQQEDNDLIQGFNESGLDDDDEPEGIDLFDDTVLGGDYQAIDGLDRYDDADLDNEEYDQMSVADRQAVEQRLLRRDRTEGRYQPFLFDEDDTNQFEITARHRRRRNVDEHDIGMDMDHYTAPEDDDELLTLVHQLQPDSAAQWLAADRTQGAIKREFKAFLMTYMEKGESVYGRKIKVMCEMNLESLSVSFHHLEDGNPMLALLLSNYPVQILPLFDEAGMDVTLINFPEYKEIHLEIHVRVTDLPILKSIRDLRESDLNSLVRLSGVVTRRTGVFPQLKYVKYDCIKCGQIIGPIHQDASHEVRVSSCPNCQSHGPFTINSQQTVYRNFQKLTLQETPGTVPPGRLPRHREVILLWDLVDSARPGEEIDIVGVYRNNFDMSLNNKNGFPVFSTVIEANSITKRDDQFASLSLTQDDIVKIKTLASDPKIGRRLVDSIAPSIYGHRIIKTAICLSLFAGVAKNVKNKHRIRGDINVLLLGDPGTAKSQFLKYVEKTSHRAVYTTGQGASAVGLTASVRKDPVTREWTLEGGALVLADKGVCLIDEFDKMNDGDRTSIHEAMEQQSISISKAGIVTSLHARCAIIAAANPIRGRYNTTVPFSQNVDLTEPILSRFDVLCVVKDTVDPDADNRLAEFIVSSHCKSHPANVADSSAGQGVESSHIIDQDLLKKYIIYAKERVHPVISAVDEDKVSKLYGELRRESIQTGSIPITVRHLESMLRMAEAHARMHLRDHVRSDDIDLAISVMLDSFISAQKYTVMRQLRHAFSKYIRFHQDNSEMLVFTLNEMMRESAQLMALAHRNLGNVPNQGVLVSVYLDEFSLRAREMGVHDIDHFLTSKVFETGNRCALGTDGHGRRRFTRAYASLS